MNNFNQTPSPRDLLLVGGGRNARNIICTLESAGITIRGVVDDNPPSEPLLGHQVGLIDDLYGADVDALLTVADPNHAERIRERPALADCRWPLVVHPLSVASSHARIGEGCYIGPFAIVTDVRLGRHVHLFAHNVLGTRVEVGDFSVILPHAVVASDARIGKRCMIGMGARIHAGVSIGDDCRVGANAVVRNNMPAGSIAHNQSKTRILSRAILGGKGRTTGQS